MPDTRSIGTRTELGIEIRSANTGELLGTSEIAQNHVDRLLDSQD